MITNRSLMKNAEIIQYPAKLKNANINMIALPFHLLDRCQHGAFAVADELVGTVGENLVAFQFGQFEVRRVNNGTALQVDRHGDFFALLLRMAEQVAHHENDVLKRVIVIVPQHNVIRRQVFRLALVATFSLAFRFFNGYGIAHLFSCASQGDAADATTAYYVRGSDFQPIINASGCYWSFSFWFYRRSSFLPIGGDVSLFSHLRTAAGVRDGRHGH